ncbi:ABC transporter substrate-binding protein [Plantactinospora siamensis]|uniref:ABC transporter substrate-binding protein n=1 Tax=Plantactinospora siamensis TaxID=555372 RepID=A0ABV6P5M2_9ACTN
MRILRAGLALVTAGAMLAACTDDTSHNSDQRATEQVSGKITMWMAPVGGPLESTWWADRVKQFTGRYPNVTVQVEVVPWPDRAKRLAEAVASHHTPDVAYLIPDEVASYADQKLLVDVSDVIADDRGDFRPAALDAVSSGGALYGVPTLMSPATTIFNRKVVDKVGLTPLPQTWDDVRNAAPRLKRAGYFTTTYDATPAATLDGTFFPLLWQAGGEVLNASRTKAAFNGPEGVRALDFAVWLADNGHLPKDALDGPASGGKAPAGQGKVAMLYSQSLGAARQGGLADSDMLLAPPLRDRRSVGYAAVGGYSIFKTSTSQAAAKAWVDWLTAPEQLRQFLPPRRQLSPRTSVTGLYPTGSPEAQAEAYLPQMTAGLIHPQARKIMDLIRPHLRAALLGEVSSREALDAAARQVDELLAG